MQENYPGLRLLPPSYPRGPRFGRWKWGNQNMANRRDVLRAGAVGAGALITTRGLGAAELSAGPSVTERLVPSNPQLQVDAGANTADVIVSTLIAWGAPFVFGMAGDGINPIIEALRKRQAEIKFIGVRHEEAAAFMASGYAKYTGRLGVCLGTTGPGAVHLLNGLYDAAFDGAPVVAITGTTFHDLIGTRYPQSVDTTALMKDVALYNVGVTGPAHAMIVTDIACRTALGARGVAHLTVARDIQQQPMSADKPSMENRGVRPSIAWLPATPQPSPDQIAAAAAILNSGKKIAILAGQGALPARVELEDIADILGAPVAKTLLGKALMPDDSPFTTGCIGHLGTLPSRQAMEECDTLLILGSTMPWIDYYPKPGQARAIQVDIKPERLGLRYPVELGLSGDVRQTLIALSPRLQRKQDRSFLTIAQQRMRDWNALTEKMEQDDRVPVRPQRVMRALSDLLDDNAIVSLDAGAITQFAARHLRIRANHKLTASGMMASAAPGVAFAIAAKLAYPQRQSVAVVGAGGFAMLMAELSTAVRLNLPIKVIVLRTDVLSETMFEQKELGNPVYGCELGPIDFVKFAEACGAEGFRAAMLDDIRPAILGALRSSKVAVVEALVDPNEAPLRPEKLQA
jgi:pyruvate dehydrogenase (quinone)/pyruvate decarboxylase